MGKKKSKPPSGLAIGRNDTTFVFGWKQGESYKGGDQKLEYATYINKWSKWTNVKISATATSKTLKNIDNIARIKFRVKGHAKGEAYKDWVESPVYAIEAPNKPALGMSVVDDYTSSFAWQTAYDNTTKKQFEKNECQTALTVDFNSNDGKKVSGWVNIGNGTSTDTGSYSPEERGWNIQTSSVTRWVKVRSVGWRNLVSDWAYAYRVYAIPLPATGVSASRSAASGSGYSVLVKWTSPETYARPIDVANVEYTKVTPNVTVVYPEEDSGTVKMTMACPTSGASWSSVVSAGGINGSRTAAFIDDSAIPDDQCFYVRISNKHDNNIALSVPVMASGIRGQIKAPSAPAATYNSSTHVWTITVNRNSSAITDAAIAIYFRSSSEQNKQQCIGVIPPGETTTYCIIPDYPTGDTISFGAMAFVGDYTPMRAPSGSQVATIFTPNPIIKSELVWAAGVPLPPEIVVEPVNETTVKVTWTWSWTEALQAELSWADHEDAWMSTNGPSTYIVDSANASDWNIAGLGIGTWYVRVRLIKPSGDSASYSAYSETKTIKLSASPDTPSLVLSSGIIPKNGTVTCYWAYVSGDGTGQRQANIYEAFLNYAEVSAPSGNPYEQLYYERSGEEGSYKYFRSFDIEVVSGKTYYQTTGNATYSSNPIGSTESAQHMDFNAEDMGWLPGETHYLAVQVISMSGETSDNYSAAVPVTIADELKVSISSTSLHTINIPSDYNDDCEVIEYRNAFSMTEFPLTIDIEGFALGNMVTCIIDRAEDYHVDRPDESEYEGFQGETILMKSYTELPISITQADLLGVFDGGGSYSVTILLNDSYGQSATTNDIPTDSYTIVENPEGNPQENGYYEYNGTTYELSTDTSVNPSKDYYTKDGFTQSFEVHWAHQAITPSAEVVIDKENNITKIRPILPESGYASGDVCDIYRLSADAPELIYEGAAFNTWYVDPYPAYGDFGGVRVVYRTYNGDYITEDNELAITDYSARDDDAYRHDTFGLIIDFDGEKLVLPGNVSFSSKWNKDFTLTKYLGGAVQGDWNPAVERSGSGNVTIPVEINPEDIELVRRLAIYPGVCHIRTPDGSSFAANIDVTDNREEKWTTRLAKISLEINKCDPEGFEGMTLVDWEREQE